MAINRRAGNIIDCLEADTKPSLSIDASLLIEKDTQKLFVLDTSWKEINYLSLDGGTVTGNLNIHDHTDKGITLSYGDPIAYLSTQGALQIEADLGYIAIGGPLFGAQPIELLDNVCINGHITCPYSLYIGSPDIGTLADSGTTFQVGGNSIFNGNIGVGGSALFESSVSFQGDMEVNDNLLVLGSSSNMLRVISTSTLETNFNVDTINGVVTTTKLTVNGFLDINDDVDISGDLDVGADTTVNNIINNGYLYQAGDIMMGDGVTYSPSIMMTDAGGSLAVVLSTQDLQFRNNVTYESTRDVVVPPFGFKRVVRNVFEATYDYTQVTTTPSVIFTLPENSRILSIEYSSNLADNLGEHLSSMLSYDGSNYITDGMTGDVNSTWKTLTVYLNKTLLNEYTSSSKAISIEAEDTFTQGEISLRVIIETKI